MISTRCECAICFKKSANNHMDSNATEVSRYISSTSVPTSKLQLGTPQLHHSESITTPRYKMWLLSTERAELHSFPNVESIVGTYAVISHVVSSDDISFWAIQHLHEQARGATKLFNPRKNEVLRCCALFGFSRIGCGSLRPTTMLGTL